MKKLLATQPGSNIQFAPARAGWNGPEAPPAQQIMNPELARVTPAAAQIEVRNAVFNALVPDPRFAVAILLAILFLRTWLARHNQIPRLQPAVVEDNQQLRPAA